MMAETTVTTPLLPHRTKVISRMLKRRYGVHIYPKGAYIVLLYCGMALSVYGSYIMDSSTLPQSMLHFTPLSYDWIVLLVFILLSNLLCGVIGEKFTRYKIVIIGIVLINLGQLLKTLLTMFLTLPFNVNPIYILVSLTYLLGFALFLTNYVQFGLDQLLHESSSKLQSYIYWLVGVVHWFAVFIFSIVPAVLTKLVPYHVLIVAIKIINGIPYLLLIISFFLICCYKRHICIEPPPKVNPVKHIYKVMQYAWLNKYPARRSAYTYTERPSRLDLCKKRYGGPFTTGEVEDVKSFWRILAVLLSMFGLFSIDTSAGVANRYYHESNSSNYSYIMDNMSFTEVVIILYPSTITYGSLFLCVLTLQLLFIPFFPGAYQGCFAGWAWEYLLVSLHQLVSLSSVCGLIGRYFHMAC